MLHPTGSCGVTDRGQGCPVLGDSSWDWGFGARQSRTAGLHVLTHWNYPSPLHCLYAQGFGAPMETGMWPLCLFSRCFGTGNVPLGAVQSGDGKL